MKTNHSCREHWSASSLRELCSCPLRYRLHRIDRCLASHRSPSLVLGGTYHQVVAHALQSLKEGEEITEEALTLWFDSLWKEELEANGPPIRWTAKVTVENQRELGISMVRAWYAQGLPLFRDTEIITIEMPFRVLPCVREFEKPSHREFRERNAWSLYNAITESSFKRMTPQRAADGFKALNEVLVGTIN